MFSIPTFAKSCETSLVHLRTCLQQQVLPGVRPVLLLLLFSSHLHFGQIWAAGLEGSAWASLTAAPGASWVGITAEGMGLVLAPKGSTRDL